MESNNSGKIHAFKPSKQKRLLKLISFKGDDMNTKSESNDSLHMSEVRQILRADHNEVKQILRDNQTELKVITTRLDDKIDNLGTDVRKSDAKINTVNVWIKILGPIIIAGALAIGMVIYKYLIT